MSKKQKQSLIVPLLVLGLTIGAIGNSWLSHKQINSVQGAGVTAQCGNDVDDDGDGDIDWPDDGNCTSSTDVTEASTQCSDGIDNDSDGTVDLADSGCSNNPDNDFEGSFAPSQTTTEENNPCNSYNKPACSVGNFAASPNSITGYANQNVSFTWTTNDAATTQCNIYDATFNSGPQSYQYYVSNSATISPVYTGMQGGIDPVYGVPTKYWTANISARPGDTYQIYCHSRGGTGGGSNLPGAFFGGNVVTITQIISNGSLGVRVLAGKSAVWNFNRTPDGTNPCSSSCSGSSADYSVDATDGPSFQAILPDTKYVSSSSCGATSCGLTPGGNVIFTIAPPCTVIINNGGSSVNGGAAGAVSTGMTINIYGDTNSSAQDTGSIAPLNIRSSISPSGINLNFAVAGVFPGSTSTITYNGKQYSVTYNPSSSTSQMCMPGGTVYFNYSLTTKPKLEIR
jgi:hypothetical protein